MKKIGSAIEQFFKDKEFSTKLIEKANVIILTLDINANIISFNKFAEILTGYSKEEVLGKNWMDLFISAQIKTAIPKVFFEVLNEMPEVSSYENPILCKNGEERLICWENTVLKDSLGKITGILSIGSDVTERRRAEEALLESEAKFKTLVINNEGIVYMIANDGTFLLSEGKGLATLGLKSGEVVGKSVFNLYEDYPDMLDKIKKTLKGETVTYELKLGDIYYRNWYTPHKNNAGEIIGLLGLSVNITERKKAEKLLKENQDYTQKIFDNSPDGLFLSKLDGTLIDGNKAALEIVGYKKGELVGRNFLSTGIQPSNQIPKALKELKNLDLGKPTKQNEFVLYKKDGSQIDVELHAKIIKLKDQKIVLGSARDITQRKLTEKGLRKSEEKYRSLVISIPDVIWTADSEGKINFISPNVEAISGYTIEEIYEKNIDFCFGRIHPEDAEKVKKAFEKLFKTGTNFDIEYRIRRKDDEWVWLRDRSISTFEKDGVIIANGLYSDITNQKLAEKKIKKAQIKLETEKSKIESILKAAPTGIGVIVDRNIVQVNKKFCEMTGYSAEELIGKNARIVYPSEKEYENVGIEKYRQISEKGTGAVETQFKRKNGEIIDVLLSSTPFNENDLSKGITFTTLNITERKNALRKLEQSETKFRLLADYTFDWEYWIDENGEYIYISPACEKISGYTVEQFKENSNLFLEIIHPDYKKEVQKHLKVEVGKETFGFKMQYIIIRADGESRWIEHDCNPVFDDQGKHLGRRGVNRDITLQKKQDLIQKVMLSISQAAITSNSLEELIDAIRAQLALIIDSTNFFIAFYDKNTNTFSSPYMSDENDKFTTWPSGKTLSDYVVNTSESLLISKEEILKMKEEGVFDIVGTLPEVWLGVPLISESGNVKGIFVLQSYKNKNAYTEQDVEMLEFVANQIRTSLEKKKAEHTLRESEERFKRLFKDLGDAVYVTVIGGEKNGQILEVNAAAVSQTGYSREELLRLNVIKDLLVPESGELSTDEWNEKLLNGETVITSELKRKKDGTEFWTEVIVTPIEYQGVKASLSINHDITKRKIAEEKLKVAYYKATESDRLKSAFLATMSHELRTPLNAIIGFSDLIQQGSSNDDATEFAKIIYNSGNHLLDIIDDVFDITLLETGQSRLKKERHLLHNIIHNVNKIIEAEVSNFNKPIDVILTIDERDKDLIISTDKAKLQQVLINLLKNALKFTSEGSIEWGYHSCSEKNESGLVFYVKDTGIGISAENQTVIFESFRQLEDQNTRTFQGTGIGLSISKKIVELLGGKIWLESELGKGSSFYFSLPCLDAYSDEPVIGNMKITNHSLIPNDKTILIAEDNESNFELLKMFLKQTKAKILWAENGKEAVDYCINNKDIHLVLMDIKMPIMDGLKATALIKEKFPDLPIIAQTAYAISGDKEKALKAGCDDYISKPIKKDKLHKLIAKYIKD